MNYDDRVLDFVERTRANLNITDRLSASGDDPFYEVTHLINSLLGLIVVPREEMINQLPKATLQRLEIDGWEFEIQPGTCLGPACLTDLVRGMRNAVAHFKIDVASGDTDGEITSITLRSEDRFNVCFWSVSFTPTQLRMFVDRLADAITSTSEAAGRQPRRRRVRATDGS